MVVFSRQKIKALSACLDSAKSVVITAHKSPDADSVGSSLGLYHYLNQKGIPTKICHPDAAPEFLGWMAGQKQIISHETDKQKCETLLSAADLVFCLDYNSPNRVGKMEHPLMKSKAVRVMIDHHQEPDSDFCKITFSDPNCSSTSQMIYELMDAMGDDKLLSKDIASCLYAGIMMDTGSFRFSSTSPKTHFVAGKLLETGIRQWEIHENIHDVNSVNRMRLNAFATLERLVVLSEYKTAYFHLGKRDLEKFSAVKGDTEGLVNSALALEGIRFAALFKEESGLIKISFRSKGTIPVNLLSAAHFEGGGHTNAAGGKFIGNIQDAIAKFEEVLPAFFKQNRAKFKG